MLIVVQAFVLDVFNSWKCGWEFLTHFSFFRASFAVSERPFIKAVGDIRGRSGNRKERVVTEEIACTHNHTRSAILKGR